MSDLLAPPQSQPEQLPSPIASDNADDEPPETRSRRTGGRPGPAKLRMLSRSPHPYSRQNFELLEPADRLVYDAIIGSRDSDGLSSANTPRPGPTSFSPSAKDSTPASESGTEADDEHFLKGLPAPRTRLHKGLRGRDEPLSGSSTPLSSPAVDRDDDNDQEADGVPALKTPLGSPGRRGVFELRDGRRARVLAEKVRRRKEVVRRLTEVALLVLQGGIIATNDGVRPFLRTYKTELLATGTLCVVLATAYPFRVVVWAYRRGAKLSRRLPLRIPYAFDPAPLLYPPLIPLFVTLLVAKNVESAVLPNLVLAICSLPRALFPSARYWEPLSWSHWLLSCLPFALARFSLPTAAGTQELSQETLVLLYPLHQALCLVLHRLTTTSLLDAELQLLSVGLINLLLLARSPQAVILKAVLWGGGLGIAALCSRVISWGIILARVPKWRFRRVAPSRRTSLWRLPRRIWPIWKLRQEWTGYGEGLSDSLAYSSDEYDARVSVAVSPAFRLVSKTKHAIGDSISDAETAPLSPSAAPETSSSRGVALAPAATDSAAFQVTRRHTLPVMANGSKATSSKSNTGTTPSGRRKRSASSSVRAFFSLTHAQAAVRKWLYAGYVYICILVIFLGGVRSYVQHQALVGEEPVGWALGYLFGDLPSFRLQVVKSNLERWICLPSRPEQDNDSFATCDRAMGWLQHVRIHLLGASNTRLALSAYWLMVIVTGLAVVMRLSPVYEVDTRRKVFHFMMVAMFLPSIYVDPGYVALALSIVLAIFLLLDLLRASQLPPLSRPIAAFLTPYVDGRDLRGPVVISHIFLLVGCAIPMWLSLASLPRIWEDGGDVFMGRGWEVKGRQLSLVAGVVCVGLGDAAASLIGRRWGHRKWLWGGGKSVEGSLAFTGAVWVGLVAAAAWLRAGGWEQSEAGGGISGWESVSSVFVDPKWMVRVGRKAGVCASVASLTEAVLTGGNDNVVVPIVLWGCVKGLQDG